MCQHPPPLPPPPSICFKQRKYMFDPSMDVLIAHAFSCSDHDYTAWRVVCTRIHVCTAWRDIYTRILLLWPCLHSVEGYLYTHSPALAMSAQRGGISIHAFSCSGHVCTAWRDIYTRILLLWPCLHSVEGYLYTHSPALAMSAQRGGISIHAFSCSGHVCTAWRDIYTRILLL